MRNLSARFDRFAHELSETFREFSHQNQLVLDRLRQVEEGFTALERAVVGD